MEETRLNPYETMFVVANKEAQKSHDYLEEHLRGLIGKVGGEVVRLDKWDERQLAYEIDGQKEGIFYLGFIQAEGSAIAELKREAELSELVLRLLVLRLDQIPDPEEVDRRSGRAPQEEEAESDSAPVAAKGDAAPEDAASSAADD